MFELMALATNGDGGRPLFSKNITTSIDSITPADAKGHGTGWTAILAFRKGGRPANKFRKSANLQT